ncbi:unnamed protein product [Adineta steineri]|uniref:Ammonium transporter n=1 Tax=Adineta steineri TaxID=433720 RepID=A0A818K1P5_9BILA|nr:unnamed protein product [Adineta steineri]CAF3550013.1 unnamed protein product [Adineta steineri]
MNTTSDNTFDTGDNAWMMTSTALVLLMTPALAFFYGGLVDHKNILNQLFLSFICMGIVFVQWVLFGFSFAFGPSVSSGFGSFGWSVLRFGEIYNPNYSPTYPLLTYCAYQGTFAVITPALISGAIVGRMKTIPYMLFIFIWTTVCYDPMAHWVWGDTGWLKSLGTLDFAGGTVVHILSGVSGFVASMIIGKRYDYSPHSTITKNLPFTILGTCLLWVGWTGFNAGSANAASGLAGLALINTHVAAAAGLLTWVIIDAIRGQISIAGACAGPVVGLVAITPACGFVQPGWAIFIGVVATCIVYGLILLKRYMRVDDTLDVAVVHGCGGIVGAFMTGLFSQKSMNEGGGADGAFYGRPIQLWYQIAGILTAIGFAAACTAGILLPLKWTIGIRLAKEDEIAGLDAIAHGVGLTEAPSPAVNDVTLQVVDEKNLNQEKPQHKDSFELQSTPTNPNSDVVTVRSASQNVLSKQSSQDHTDENTDQQAYFVKTDSALK